MKILQINAVYGVRSTGRNVSEMDGYFQKKGYGSYVVATRLTQKYDNVYEIGNRMEWYLHQGLSRITGHQGYFSGSSTKKMLTWVDYIRPDVIHINNIRAGAFNFPLLFEYFHKRDIPVVLTLHDCFMYTGRCWYYTLKGCNQWQTRCVRCPSTEMCEASYIFDFSEKLFKDKKNWFQGIRRLGVVGVSDWITNEARKSFLKSASIIKRVYNWVDLDVFKPASLNERNKIRKKLNLDNRFIVMGIASSITKDKGLNEFIQLAHKNPEIRIVLVGDMSYKGVLPANVLKLGTINKIEQLSKLYSIADVMVNPSPQETFGKTSAEALACGTPVIGYNMTATSELITDKTGILVDYSKGAGGINKAVKEVIKTGKDKYLEQCREFAEKNFSMEDNIEQYIRIYEELIKWRA